MGGPARKLGGLRKSAINGPPQKLMIGNRPVFVCCKGCLAEAKAHPDQTLAALDKLMARVRAAAKK